MTTPAIQAEIQCDKIIKLIEAHLSKLKEDKDWPDEINHSDDTVTTATNILKSLQQIHKRFILEDLDVARAKKIYRAGKKLADQVESMQQAYYDKFKDQFTHSQRHGTYWLRYLAYYSSSYFQFEFNDDDKFKERVKRLHKFIQAPLKLTLHSSVQELFEEADLYHQHAMEALHAQIKFNTAARLIYGGLEGDFQIRANEKARELLAQAQSTFCDHFNYAASKQCEALFLRIDQIPPTSRAESKSSSSSSSTALMASKIDPNQSIGTERQLRKYETQIVHELFEIGVEPVPGFTCDYSKVTHYLGIDFDDTLVDMLSNHLLDSDELLKFFRALPENCLIDVITARPDMDINRDQIRNTLEAIQNELGRKIFRNIYFANNNSKEFVMEQVREINLPHLPKDKFCLWDDQSRMIYQCKKAGFRGVWVDRRSPQSGHFDELRAFVGMKAPVQQTSMQQQSVHSSPTLLVAQPLRNS